MMRKVERPRRGGERMRVLYVGEQYAETRDTGCTGNSSDILASSKENALFLGEGGKLPVQSCN